MRTLREQSGGSPAAARAEPGGSVAAQTGSPGPERYELMGRVDAALNLQVRCNAARTPPPSKPVAGAGRMEGLRRAVAKRRRM